MKQAIKNWLPIVIFTLGVLGLLAYAVAKEVNEWQTRNAIIKMGRNR